MKAFNKQKYIIVTIDHFILLSYNVSKESTGIEKKLIQFREDNVSLYMTNALSNVVIRSFKLLGVRYGSSRALYSLEEDHSETGLEYHSVSMLGCDEEWAGVLRTPHVLWTGASRDPFPEACRDDQRD